jgi:two-component system, NtrC family, response regulator HydG
MSDAATTVNRQARDLLSGTGRFELELPSGGARQIIDASLPTRALIGTSSTSFVQLDDRSVSRRHVALEVEGRLLKVTDLGSTNGTRVNGVRVREAWLAGGEMLALGDCVLRVHYVGESGTDDSLDTDHLGQIIGMSPRMQKLYPLLERLARSDVPIVVEGETGTGKELVAEAIHQHGPRAAKPFVVFDCTTVAPTLMESALFGHERGAFTGAVATQEGVFEEAHGGTLFIDEIGELDLTLQPKLLRAVQRAEVRRVGGNRWLSVDVRIIAATRRDLDAEVASGRFREDLFYRLAVGRVELPPLRDRTGDIGLLARHFWDAMGGGGEIPYDLFEDWERYAWPGNVRELENAVARRLALGDLAPAIAAQADSAGETADLSRWLDLPLPVAREELVRELERRYLERMLELHDGKSADAANASGVGRRYFNMLRARHRL